MTWFRQETERQELFSELLERFGDRAYDFAYRLTGNEQDARDLTQEAFLRAYERLDAYDPSRPFGTWLGTLLKRIYIDGLRRLDSRGTLALDAAAPDADDGWSLLEVLADAAVPALEALAGREADRSVRRALARLDPGIRSAVALCDMEGLSYEEAAEVMGCAVGTVRSRLARGRARLRQLLAPYVEQGQEVGHGTA